ncbi:hypothetical protein [Actinomadura flavalba]|uniref:hypothetical protein n=1 Tax=Actinomadura flavalba TaxID=1120938 RepID=UPI001F0B1164|nr:hypothetical protein [Actinomadura flavalba]
MGDSLTLPVAETLHATYAVVFGDPPADPRELAREEVAARVAAPLRGLVLGMLDSPMLTLDLRAAADFPPLPVDLITAYGADPSELSAIASAAHVLAVRAAYRPGWPPAHEWAARAVAGAVAAARSAPVVDVFTPRVLERADLLRSLPGPDGDIALTDWMLIEHSSGPHGFYFVTRGLARFGLPELQTEHVPPALVTPWSRLLNGLARRLLDLWLDELPGGELPVFADLPDTVSVGLHDVAAAQGLHDPLHREVSVRLRADTPALLTVLPADDGPDRLENLCTALFGEGVT